MTTTDAQETLNRFVVELYLQTQGNPSKTVSWYDIGDSIGLDREASSHSAEELIGTGLAEIKTLNGGISITGDGIAEAELLGASLDRQDGIPSTLGASAVLDGTGSQAVEKIAAGLKNQLREKKLDFDSLSALVADLKSIDAQLSSPNPKTAVIRECFRSIMGVLQKANDSDNLARLKQFLGE